MSFIFPPRGWALCNGQLLPINQNFPSASSPCSDTTFGGRRVNFAFLTCEVACPGCTLVLQPHAGRARGVKRVAHTLAVVWNSPCHTHRVNAATSATGGSATPSGNVLGGGNNVYARTGPTTTLHPNTVQSVGGSQPHPNMQPFLTISFCIALQGIFPSST